MAARGRRKLAGTVGLEPTSLRLTGGCSTVELHAKKMVDRDGIAPPSAGLQPAALLPKLPIRLVERVGVEPTKPIWVPGLQPGYLASECLSGVGADGEPRTHNLLFTR